MGPFIYDACSCCERPCVSDYRTHRRRGTAASAGRQCQATGPATAWSQRGLLRGTAPAEQGVDGLEAPGEWHTAEHYQVWLSV